MRLRIFSKRDAGNRLLPAVVLAGSVVLYGALTMAARGRGSVLEDRRPERDRYGGDEGLYEPLGEGLFGGGEHSLGHISLCAHFVSRCLRRSEQV